MLFLIALFTVQYNHIVRYIYFDVCLRHSGHFSRDHQWIVFLIHQRIRQWFSNSWLFNKSSCSWFDISEFSYMWFPIGTYCYLVSIVIGKRGSFFKLIHCWWIYSFCHTETLFSIYSACENSLSMSPKKFLNAFLLGIISHSSNI